MMTTSLHRQPMPTGDGMADYLDGPRVFVSSRFAEFRELRELVVKTLIREGFVVIELNDGMAAPVDTRNRSYGGVADADALLLFVGATYSEDPTLQTSITHDEFRKAVEAEIPVFAYSLPKDEIADERALRFRQEVAAKYTVGRLTRDWYLDADRIAKQLAEHLLAVSEDDGRARTLGQSLQHELTRLGAVQEDGSFRIEGVPSAEMLSLNQRREWALNALVQNNLAEARRQLDQATAAFAGDWATNYMQAHVLEARGLKSDYTEALKCAARAVEALGTSADLTSTNGKRIGDLRLSAAQALEARLARQMGEAHRAFDVASRLTGRDRFAREGWVELLRAALLVGDDAAVDLAVRRLFEMSPDRLDAVIRQLDGDDHSRIMSRARELLRATSPVSLDSSEERFDALLAGVRVVASEERDSLRGVFQTLTEAAGALEVRGGWSIDQLRPELVADAEQRMRPEIVLPASPAPARMTALNRRLEEIRSEIQAIDARQPTGQVKPLTPGQVLGRTALGLVGVGVLRPLLDATSLPMPLSWLAAIALLLGVLWVCASVPIRLVQQRRERRRVEQWPTLLPRRMRMSELEIAALSLRRLEESAFELAHAVGEPSLGSLAVTISDVKKGFDERFATHSNIFFADYVPVERAEVGDLTRIDDNGAVDRDAGILRGSREPRLVRLTSVGASDLAVFVPDADPALLGRIETCLRSWVAH